MDTTIKDPLVGQALDGRYLIESRIAVGGMATVYRAVDTRLDRLLAVKVMHPALAADSAFVDRFIREAKSVARLDHPNVVNVFDQGNDGTHVYLAMEYVAGCTLRDVLRERGALQPRAALDIAEPVLAALGAAHRAGLVHRDMKPENVLIGDDGRVKVADFGLVRAVGTDTTSSTGSVLGTVSYLAPEQIQDGVADQRSDVYACAILLYEMLTGAKPHSGGTPAAVLYQHLHEDVPPPSGLVPGLAPALDTLVATAASRDPGRRPADAVEMLAVVQDVRAALSDEQLDAVPATAFPAGAPADAEGTTVLPRTPGALPDEAGRRLNHTTRMQLPPDLIRADDGADDGPAAAAGGHRAAPARSRRGPVALLVALVVLLGGGAVVWYVSAGQFTNVPAVLAISQARAEQRLRSAGLGAHVSQAYSETAAKGTVISTDPGPGGRIRGNGVVDLVVSRGPQRIDVPRLAGLPLAKARQRVTAAGLTPGTVSKVFDASVPAGSVVSTTPAAGTPRRTGDAIALTVSRGAAVPVPDVVGSTVSDAEQALQAAGLKADVSGTPVYSDNVPKDSVAQESPGAGGKLAKGDTVRLSVSKGQQLFKVPDVTGESTDDAKSALKKAGFQVSVINLFFTGTVFNESPGGGSMQPKNTTITLWAR
ncbi:Stk1 family PASTA domain-containing Ser/Thr kinase [Streptomyces sp. SL13]|uniref:non-specific serine/threonine protein kinase n=1 Tax=Streptantibioticus silvisoli TaxID=2705255 RepID=A0AA90KGI2_9ACTN|nr:Stk1 family PASTA domain-containing Ser/Thr kinase [Streptantibioticus silvisoli]MDI5970229.1 Stk1 family PASTA domain-containing Ser/Thr kinase [Streptantibioticus silvisoli]